jgi:hypothetical protein
MEQKGIALVRELMDKGFFYDNLQQMTELCGEERRPDRLLTAYVVGSIISGLARELGERPVTVSTTRKLEARYRTEINLALEEAISGGSTEKQFERLTRLISLHWDIKEPSC